MSNHHVDVQALLAESAWLVRLARRLVADPNVADDLAQQTLAAALQRPPRSNASLRGWLAAALRNFVRQLRRGETRRSSRERDAAERTHARAQGGEERAACRTVAGVVLALEEPYRTTVILRYYDGLEPREIAALQRVSVRTVDTRLARAHQRLRERLQREFGKERRDFALVLWMLATTPERPLAPQLAARAKIALAAAAGIALVAAVLVARSPRAAPAAGPARAESAALAPETPAELALVDATAPSEPVEPASLASAETRATAPANFVRVLDASGAPVAGVALRYRAGEEQLGGNGAHVFAPDEPPVALELGASDASGRVALAPLPGPGSIEPCGDFAALFAARVPAVLGSANLVVVVAPARELAGRVADAFGRPLAGAELLLRVPESFYPAFPEPLDRARAVEPVARTGRDGTFALASTPDVERAALEITCAGFTPQAIAPARGDQLALALALEADATSEFAVHGHVVGADGLPLADAVVTCAGARASVDADGRFLVAPREPAAAVDVVALAPGCLPAAARVSGRASGAQWVFPEPVVLRLSEPSLAIDGRVFDSAGRPVPHAILFTPDAQVAWVERDLPVMAESVLGRRAHELLLSLAADENGAFHFDGLMQREYSLWAFDPRTCQEHGHGAVRAGSSDVRIDLPAGNLVEVAGRLITPDGEPVRGTRVVAYAGTLHAAREWLGDALFWRERGPEAVTDLDGRFHFGALAVSKLMFEADSPELFRRGIAFDPEQPATEQEVVALRRCYVRLELADEAWADHFRFSNARGEPEYATYFMDTGLDGVPTLMSPLPLLEGKSSWAIVPETATALHLYAGEQEVARLPIALAPGEVTQLRY